MKPKKGIMQQAKRIQNKLVDILDIPQDALLSLHRLTLIGEHQLYLENHKGIIEYNAQFIKVSVIGGTVEIQGKLLSLKNIKSDEIAVEGEISSIKFTK
jgi:sporulation protein YqfC